MQVWGGKASVFQHNKIFHQLVLYVYRCVNYRLDLIIFLLDKEQTLGLEDAVEMGKGGSNTKCYCTFLFLHYLVLGKIQFKYYEIILYNPNLRKKVKPATLCLYFYKSM